MTSIRRLKSSIDSIILVCELAGGGGCAEYISVSDCEDDPCFSLGSQKDFVRQSLGLRAREDTERRQRARPRSVRESETHRIIRRALERYIRRRVDRLFMVDDGCALPSRNSSCKHGERKRSQRTQHRATYIFPQLEHVHL